MSMNLQRYDLVRHGRVLATRELGREVGRHMADILGGSDGVLASLWQVDVASLPFLTEMLIALRAHLAADDRSLLLFAGMNEDVRESLELAARRQKMSVAALANDQVELLGGSAQLADTLRAAQEAGEFTAPDLADRLSIKLPALHQRLNILVEAGALSREDDSTATRGRRSKYKTLSQSDVDELSDGLAPEEIAAVTTA